MKYKIQMKISSRAPLEKYLLKIRIAHLLIKW